MDTLLRIAWFIATVTSWLSFGFASWEWAGNSNRGMFSLMILWFVMSLLLFLVGLRFRRSSS
jgi:hypothetical protein